MTVYRLWCKKKRGACLKCRVGGVTNDTAESLSARIVWPSLSNLCAKLTNCTWISVVRKRGMW